MRDPQPIVEAGQAGGEARSFGVYFDDLKAFADFVKDPDAEIQRISLAAVPTRTMAAQRKLPGSAGKTAPVQGVELDPQKLGQVAESGPRRLYRVEVTSIFWPHCQGRTSLLAQARGYLRHRGAKPKHRNTAKSTRQLGVLEGRIIWRVEFLEWTWARIASRSWSRIPVSRGPNREEVVEERVPTGDGPAPGSGRCRRGPDPGRSAAAMTTRCTRQSLATKSFFTSSNLASRVCVEPSSKVPIGAELEGVLPIDLEDMVYAFEQIPKMSGPSGRWRSSTKTDHGGWRYPHGVHPHSARPRSHCRGAGGYADPGGRDPKVRAEEFLVVLRAQGVDPRGLLAAPAPYARVAEKLVTEANW